MRPVHEELLEAARRLAAGSERWTFTRQEIFRALPHLDRGTLSTHLSSRCCVNAPKNHFVKYNYFRRIGRGTYQIEPAYRTASRKIDAATASTAAGQVRADRRDTIHVVVSRSSDWYVAECLEIGVVTQGRTLDETVQNLREAVALHLEDEDISAMGLVASPRLQFVYEMSAAS